MAAHKYALRVPQELWVELVAAAGRNRRSVNQEIVWRLSERGERVTSRRIPEGTADPHVAMPPSAPRSENRYEPDPAFRPDFKVER
jgi:hypothetical protein